MPKSKRPRKKRTNNKAPQTLAEHIAQMPIDDEFDGGDDEPMTKRDRMKWDNFCAEARYRRDDISSSVIVKTKSAMAEAFEISITTATNWVTKGVPHTKIGKEYQFDLLLVHYWQQGRLWADGFKIKLTSPAMQLCMGLAAVSHLDDSGNLSPGKIWDKYKNLSPVSQNEFYRLYWNCGGLWRQEVKQLPPDMWEFSELMTESE